MVPVIVFGVLVAVMLGATSSAVAATTVTQTAQLQSLADNAASSLTSTLVGALAPLLTVKAFVEGNPGGANQSVVMAFWAATAPSLLAAAPAPATGELQLAPFGRVVAFFPLASASINSTAVLAAGGLDLFNASGAVDERAGAVQGLESRALVLEGPTTLLQCAAGGCGDGGSSGLALIGRFPLFPPAPLGGGSPSWGDAAWPGVDGAVVGPITAVTNCTTLVNAATGRSFCAANATGDGTQFWGFATSLIFWDALLQQTILPALGGGGLLWSLARSPADAVDGAAAPAADLVAVAGNAAPPLPAVPYLAGVVSAATAFNTRWVVSVQLPGGWAPAWLGGVYAACVVVAAAVAVAVFFVTLERLQHRSMLYAMLPRKVYQRVLADGTFSEAVPHITVRRPQCRAARTRAHVTHASLPLSMFFSPPLPLSLHFSSPLSVCRFCSLTLSAGRRWLQRCRLSAPWACLIRCLVSLTTLPRSTSAPRSRQLATRTWL